MLAAELFVIGVDSFADRAGPVPQGRQAFTLLLLMTERLRIGIDGRVLSVRNKGIARYIWELCRGLDTILPQAQFYLYSREPIGLPPISGRWQERSDTGFARRIPKGLWAVTRPGLMARRDGIDVFWGGTGFIPLLGLSARSVLSVHDLVFKLMPETMASRERWAMNMFFEASLSRAGDRSD